MQPISDDLTKKAAKGDKRSFEEIYRISSGYVFNVALKVIGNREDAEEVVQDVYVSVYKNLWKYKFKASFKTWVYRVTVNMAINHYRKRARKKEVGMDPENINWLEGQKQEYTDPKFQSDTHTILRKVLSILPVEQRVCIVLREIQGFSYKEISKIIKVNINTVKIRIKRAREKMMEYCKKEKCYEM